MEKKNYEKKEIIHLMNLIVTFIRFNGIRDMEN